MSLVVNSNIASIATRRALDRNQGTLQVAMQRLSSGLRVNSARDDAAGLAIAARMTSEARGDAVALRNTNDGISLLQTGDQALASMTDRLQHVREVAVQALNGTLGESDRSALDRDVQAALKEADRVAGATSFNGKKLLDGSFGSGDFQVGAHSGDTVAVDLSTSVRTSKLGAIATATSADLRTLNGGGAGGGFQFAGTYTTVPITNFDFSRPDVPLHPGSTLVDAGVATNYAGAGNSAVISVDGRNVTLASNYGSLGGVVGAIQSQLDGSAPGSYVVSQSSGQVKIAKTSGASNAPGAPAIAAVSGSNAAAFASNAPTNGNAASSNTHAGFTVDGHRVSLTSDVGDANGLIGAIQQQLDTGAPGVYSVSGGASGISIQHAQAGALPSIGGFTDTGGAVFARGPGAHLTLAAGDLSVQVGSGHAIDITGNFTTAESLANAIQAKVPAVSSVHIDEQTGQLKINATQTITLAGNQAGGSGALDFAQLSNPPSGSLDDAAVTNQDNASDTVLRIDAAIDTLAGQRSTFGSLLARFDTISSSVQRQQAIVEGSRGRIVDADFAGESASLARSQVLQQAGVALLAQANAQPSQVLQLLRS